ncbi:MAG: Fic family protein [Acidobacteria bacterium]|nr:Fic family protein [Acidobacteriota bacterium]
MLPIRQHPAWAAALDRAKSEFESLQPGPHQVAGIAGWLLLEHVQQDLEIDGIKPGRERLANLLDGVILPASREDLEAVHYGMAVKVLGHRATEMAAIGPSTDAGPLIPALPELTLDLLQSLHRLAHAEDDPRGGQWRERKAVPFHASHQPCSPEELPKLLELAMGWFSAESLRELHPLEQAALVHLRLFELQPFDHASGRISRLASSLYAIRAGLPPIIIEASVKSDYHQAILSGFQMNTVPLVELFARSSVRILRHLLDITRARTD